MKCQASNYFLWMYSVVCVSPNGWCSQAKAQLLTSILCFFQVTELAPMRSLLECLKEPSLRVEFPLPRLCDFAQQICDGMSYLESKRLIHRDLAARNILVFNKSMVS